MVAFVIPDKCGRCGRRTNSLSMASFPISPPRKKGKKLVFSYTPVVYICNKCITEFIEWWNEKFLGKGVK